jgi:hypothetical protein
MYAPFTGGALYLFFGKPWAAVRERFGRKVDTPKKLRF